MDDDGNEDIGNFGADTGNNNARPRGHSDLSCTPTKRGGAREGNDEGAKARQQDTAADNNSGRSAGSVRR